LLLLRTRWSRLRGIRMAPPGWGVLLRARSVHTFAMTEPLTVVGISGAGKVRWVEVVGPGRIVADGEAAWMAEMPAGRPGPRVGAGLLVVPMLGRWPDP